MGDNITVKKGATVLTHKVVRIIYEDGTRSFITKGTMNNAEDKAAAETDVVGKVAFQSLFLGRIIVFCQRNILFILIGIAALIAGVSLIKYFMKKTQAEISACVFVKNRVIHGGKHVRCYKFIKAKVGNRGIVL